MDVRDILDIEVPTDKLTKEFIIGGEKLKRKHDCKEVPKRPKGMPREVFALLCEDNDVSPLFPTDTGIGYKSNKAKLGMKKVRPWQWASFNPANNSKAVLHHWRRVEDAGKENPLEKFNKEIPIPTYTNAEYIEHLVTSEWTRAETDHLFELCRRFDLRFIIIHDRWDKLKYSAKTVEDLKSRYYQVCAALNKEKNQQAKVYVFDHEHERRRKEQLKRLFERSREQSEEEQSLIKELKKIEQLKKGKVCKTQEFQKLSTVAEHQVDLKKNDRKSSNETSDSSRPKLNKILSVNVVKLQEIEPTGITFPDLKKNGVFLGSEKLKLPKTLSQRKLKSIEQTLVDLKLDLNPLPTDTICTQFNELRSCIVPRNKLKNAFVKHSYEIQSLKRKYEALMPGKTLVIPEILQLKDDSNAESENIDIVGSQNEDNVSD